MIIFNFFNTPQTSLVYFSFSYCIEFCLNMHNEAV